MRQILNGHILGNTLSTLSILMKSVWNWYMHKHFKSHARINSPFVVGNRTRAVHGLETVYCCCQPLQYIPRNTHTVFALLCFVVVIHGLIFPYPSGLLHWHCGNLTIAPVPAKQPWWIWINTPCEFIMNDCITTTKQSTTKPCAYFLGYTVYIHHTRLLLPTGIGSTSMSVSRG